jgi:hypothetical protein
MRRTTDIGPSWEVFESCPRCNAKAGQPCTDMRGSNVKSWIPLANPHPKRKKIKK